MLVYPDIPDGLALCGSCATPGSDLKFAAHVSQTGPPARHTAAQVRFDGDSKELFVAWLTDLEGKLRDVGLHPALASHMAKYRILMPSLALLFELADDGRDKILLQHAKQAAAWCGLEEPAGAQGKENPPRPVRLSIVDVTRPWVLKKSRRLAGRDAAEAW